MSHPVPTPQPVLPGPGEPRCGKMAGEAGGVSYPCRLSPGHTSPCYTPESARATREWTSWAQAEIAKQQPANHVHDWKPAGDHLIVCICGEQQRTVEAMLPEEEAPDPMAQQFSAATGVQAALREEKLHPTGESSPATGSSAPTSVPGKAERDEAFDVAAAMVESTDPSPDYEIPVDVEGIVAEMRKHHRYADNGDLPLSKRFLALTAVGILFEHLDEAMIKAGHAGWPAP